MDAGADVRFIAEMLSHQKLETTMNYTRVSMAKLRKRSTRAAIPPNSRAVHVRYAEANMANAVDPYERDTRGPSGKATYGTGSSLMMLTPALVSQTGVLARTVAWSAPAYVRYALEGNIAMSGAALQWVGEFLGLPHPAEDVAALAETVPDAAGVLLVPAMVGLGAPHWDASARGLIANLERSHTAAHLARAAVDAIAFQVADVLEAMESAAAVDLPVLLADGGATRNPALMQMQADIIGRPVHRATQEDLSARGAAMLAGLAINWWKSAADLTHLPKQVQTFEPRMSSDQREELRQSWRLAVRRARLRDEMKAGTPC